MIIHRILLATSIAFFALIHSSHGLAATARKAGGGGFGAKTSTISDLTPDTSPEIQTLLAVLQQQKAEIDNVAVGHHPTHGRGLYATKNFSKKQGGQILCKIPSDCALALADPAQQSTLSVAQEAANLHQMYLHDETKRQQFAFYLDTLPPPPVPVQQQTPDFYEPSDLALLEFPRLLQKTQEKLVDILSTAKSTGISVADLQYATWLVTSRSIPLAMSSDDEVMAEFDDRGQVLQKADRTWIRILVPLLDLVNHSSAAPNAKLTILDPQKDNVRLWILLVWILASGGYPLILSWLLTHDVCLSFVPSLLFLLLFH